MNEAEYKVQHHNPHQRWKPFLPQTQIVALSHNVPTNQLVDSVDLHHIWNSHVGVLIQPTVSNFPHQERTCRVTRGVLYTGPYAC